MPETELLQAGDILVRDLVEPSSGGLVCAVVAGDDLPAVASHALQILRPLRPLTRAEQVMTLLYLRSPLAVDLLAANGRGQSLHVGSLAELPIPVPDDGLASAIEDLDAAAQRLQAWHKEADEALGTVFTAADAATARATVVRSGRKVRLKTDAAMLIDDFAYTLRTRYPHPIAYRWRVVEAKLSSTDQRGDAYAEILEAAEVLHAYGANVALALVREAGMTLGATDAVRTKLSSRQNGVSYGDWIAILQEACQSKKVKLMAADSPLTDFASFFGVPEVDEARSRLKQRRDDHAHQRRLSPAQLESELAEAYEDLVLVLRAAEFLCDLPLVQAIAVRWDSLSGTSDVAYREVMGDHPVVPARTTEYLGHGLEQDSLYLVDSSHRWHLLRPFLTGRECPRCGNWSTFHLDRSRNDSVAVKSMEHGHEVADELLTVPFRSAGLL